MEVSNLLSGECNGPSPGVDRPLWDHLVDRHRVLGLDPSTSVRDSGLRPLAHLLGSSQAAAAPGHPKGAPESSRPVPAAVLATFVVSDWGSPLQDAGLLFVRRSRNLRKHPGQIGFPGGRVEPIDADPLQAALREAHEEVRLETERVRLVGPLTPGETKTGFQLHPYIAVTDQRTFQQDAQEIDEVHLVALRDLLSCPVRYEVRGWQEISYRVVFFDLQEICVWGITGFLLEEILRDFFDWRPRPAPLS